MPFRLTEHTAKIQFLTSASMPARIYRACLKTETISNTVYIQHAVCEALSRDLGIPLDTLLAELPPPRGRNKTRWTPDDAIGARRIGPTGSVESVMTK